MTATERPAPARIQRFEILEELGAGGMGTVYRARDPQLEREVAIKVLHAETPAPPELSWERTVDLRAEARETASDSLLAEARVMARLSHPNVLPVFEAGLHDGAVFLVVELVEGTNLRAWLRERPPAERVRDALVQAGRGLAAAHARDIVHGDFKPDNVLVGRDGRVRVADFGLSQLARRPTLVRDSGAIGTPDYMAPELLRGGERSKSSDVFAYARSFAEATSGVAPQAATVDLLEAVTPHARTLLAAALSDEPARRPALETLVAALEGARARRRSALVVLGLGAGLAAAGVAALVWSRGDTAPACSLDEAGPPWTMERRIAVLRAVGANAGEVVALIDRKHAEIDEARQRTCAASTRGELTAAARATRESCLHRREIELDAIVTRIVETPMAAVPAGDAVFGMASISGCDVITAPPLVIPPAVVEPVVRRYLFASDLRGAKEQLVAFTEIARDADALGEPELVARSEIMRGFRLRSLDRSTEAIEAFRRGHQRAMEISAFDIAAAALSERANMVSGTGDFAAAESLVSLALELFDKPGVQMWTQARLLLASARNNRMRAHFTDGLAQAQRGRELLTRSGRLPQFVELPLRQEQLRCLRGLGGRPADSLALAQDTVEYARKALGEQAANYGVTLGDLARELYDSRRREEAVEIERRAVAVATRNYGATHSDTLRSRSQLAGYLMTINEYQAGRDEILAVLAASEGNLAARDRRPFLLHALAEADYNLGEYDEAMRLMQQAVEEELAIRGTTHPLTTGRVRTLLFYALELGRREEARAALQRVERAYAERTETPKDDVLSARYYVAEIALQDGKPADAEAVAREALLGFRELSIDKTENVAEMYDILARALVAQRRGAEALAAAEASIAIARSLSLREDAIAIRQVTWIEAAMSLGRTADARSLAASVRELLARYPGQPRARATIARLATKLGLPR